MAEVLAGIALQRALRCDITSQLESEPSTNLAASNHRDDKMWSQGTVFLDVVVATPSLMRYDSLN
jgi:hypothetical protein